MNNSSDYSDLNDIESLKKAYEILGKKKGAGRISACLLEQLNGALIEVNDIEVYQRQRVLSKLINQHRTYLRHISNGTNYGYTIPQENRPFSTMTRRAQ